MKKLAIVFVFLATIVITAVSEAQDIPSSARFRAAICRLKPKLQSEFSREGVTWGTPIVVRIFKKRKELRDDRDIRKQVNKVDDAGVNYFLTDVPTGVPTHHTRCAKRRKI